MTSLTRVRGGEGVDTYRRRTGEGGGRDRRDAATSPGGQSHWKLEEAMSRFSPRARVGGGPSWHFDFRLLPSRTVRKEACVLSAKVSAIGNEYRKPIRVRSLPICTVFWVKTSEVSAPRITSRKTSRVWGSSAEGRDGWGAP